jgi:LPXTG-site transpeptidase (sortase) family protein
MLARLLISIRTGLLFIVLITGLTTAFTGVVLADEPAAADAAHIPTRLVISTINLDTTVVPVGWKPVVINGQTYGQWETADDLVGWHNLSARLDEGGNTVLAGHSDVYARVFQHLKNVNIGDTIVVFAGEQAHNYIVTDMILVQERGVSLQQRIDNAKLIAATGDERLTLITCAQPGATHRLIVIARPIPAG